MKNFTIYILFIILLVNQSYAITFVKVSGYIYDNNTMQNVLVTFDSGGGTTTTDANGYYEIELTPGWSGTATPSLADHTFSPTSISYVSLTSDRSGQSYYATYIYVYIDGYVYNLDHNNQPMPGVDIVFSNGAGTATTDANGYYKQQILKEWSGTATPSKPNHNFYPEFKSYTPIYDDILEQNFEAMNPNSNFETYVKIAGRINDENYFGIAGVEISFGDDYNSVTTDEMGYYESKYIRKGWIGTVTPVKEDHTFSPESYDFNPIENYEWNADFMATSDYIFIGGWVRDDNNTGVSEVEVSFNNNGGTVKTDDVGYYSNFVLRGTQYTVTPTKEGFNFLPSSRTHTGMYSESEQNYNATISNSSNSTLSILDNTSSLPSKFTVLPAYPNPFNPSTTITYGLAGDSHVSINIYDLSGKLISTLQSSEQTQGWHSIIWNGTNQQGENVPAGIYLSRIISNNNTKTTKFMLLK